MIRIPITKSSFDTQTHPFEFINDVHFGLEKRHHQMTVDEINFERDPRKFATKIGVTISEAVHTDRIKKNTVLSTSFTSIPNGIRASILSRMFGEKGDGIPRWLPEWMRAKLRPRMKEIMTSCHSRTELHYQRVCPHKGNQGHGNFLFGPELTFADRKMKNDLYRAAEISVGMEFAKRIRKLIFAFKRNGHVPTLISLGRRETHLLRSSAYLDQTAVFADDEVKSFMGIKVEMIERDSYLSIV